MCNTEYVADQAGGRQADTRWWPLMTIGVAAHGPRAGAAVRAAVLAAELLGRGAIGGFGVFAILDGDGELRYRVTQNGGITALALPDEWLDARFAAVISSGPNRPEPLAQFLPGKKGVGLVTGHRLPNLPGLGGVPLNQAALAGMAAGNAPQQAVENVLAANPEADAGLIAMDAQGRLGWGNTARVARRADRGEAFRDNGDARLAVLHNSIHAQSALSDDVADLAWSQLTGQQTSLRFLYLREPVPVRAAGHDRVHVTAEGVITAIDSANPELPHSRRRGTVVYLGSEVWLDGRRMGHAATELVAEMADGKAARPPGAPVIPIVMKGGTHVAP